MFFQGTGGVPPAGKSVFSPVGAPIFRTFTFNANGTVFVPGSAAGMARYNPANGWFFHDVKAIDNSIPYNAATLGATSQVIDTLKWDFNRALVSAPQNRYSLFATGHYDLTDNLTFFARGSLAESATRTALFGTNAIAGWEAQVPYNPATDSPLNPGIDYTNAATVAAALAAVRANPERPDLRQPDLQADRHGRRRASRSDRSRRAAQQPHELLRRQCTGGERTVAAGLEPRHEPPAAQHDEHQHRLAGGDGIQPEARRDLDG